MKKSNTRDQTCRNCQSFNYREVFASATQYITLSDFSVGISAFHCARNWAPRLKVALYSLTPILFITMKKTLIALMALAGMAAAETLTFDVKRDVNAITFEFDEVTAQEILTLTYTDWTYSGGGNNTVGSWQSPKNEKYQNSFSPDAQLRDNQPDSWTMNFIVKNNGENAITLTQFTFDCYCISAGGEDKTGNTKGTLKIGNVSTGSFLLGMKGETTTGTLALTGDNAITINANESVSIALTMTDADLNNTYSGITGGSVTYSSVSLPDPTPAVPEPATATLSLLALAGLAARRRRK